MYDIKYYVSDSTLIELRDYRYQNNHEYFQTLYDSLGNKKSSGKISNRKKEGKWLELNEEGVEIENKYVNGEIPIKEVKAWKIKPENKFESITPTKENAIIKVYRPWVLNKYAKAITFKIGDEEYQISNGQCFEYEIKTDGVYQFKATTNKTNILRLDVKIGRTYFLKVDVNTDYVDNYDDPHTVEKTKLSIVYPNIGKKDFNMMIKKDED